MPWTNPPPTTTLTIPTGATSGQRIVIDGATGLIEVYDSAGDLRVTIGGPNGWIASENPATFDGVTISGGQIFLGNDFGSQNPAIIQQHAGAPADYLSLASPYEPGDSPTSMTMHADVASAGVGYISTNQRGIVGSLLQNDDGGNTPSHNLEHSARYVVTTNASGVFTVAHGASFTPLVGVAQNCLSSGIATPYFLDLFDDKFDATNMQGKIWNSAGAAFASATLAFFGILKG